MTTAEKRDDEWLAELVRRTPECFCISSNGEMKRYLERTVSTVDLWMFGMVELDARANARGGRVAVSTVTKDARDLSLELMDLFKEDDEEDLI